MSEPGPSALPPTGGVVVAVDVGGTTMKGSLVDPAYGLVRSLRRVTPTGDPTGEPLLAALGELIDELSVGTDVQALGVVVPGVVDEATGTALWSENIGFRDLALRDRLIERHALPVAVGHDVRAGALAEQRLGAGRGVDTMVFVPLGTGIAAGLVLQGRTYAAHGWAGEIGHADVGHGEPCVCGGTGCLEAISSASAIARRYAAATGTRVDGAHEVAQRVEAGDSAAVRVWDEAVEALSLSFQWLAAVLAPEVIVVGGGLAQSGELLMGPLRTSLDARLTFHRRPRLVCAELGADAGCLGAALLARESMAG